MAKSSMPVVYIAGSYRSPTREGVELNIQAARNVGLHCARRGWAPIIPHANTAHLDAIDPAIGDQFWLDATMAMMERCDALVLVPGWGKSVGTKAEVRRAGELGLKVFYTVEDMPNASKWVQDEYMRPFLDRSLGVPFDAQELDVEMIPDHDKGYMVPVKRRAPASSGDVCHPDYHSRDPHYQGGAL